MVKIDRHNEPYPYFSKIGRTVDGPRQLATESGASMRSDGHPL